MTAEGLFVAGLILSGVWVGWSLRDLVRPPLTQEEIVEAVRVSIPRIEIQSNIDGENLIRLIACVKRGLDSNGG